MAASRQGPGSIPGSNVGEVQADQGGCGPLLRPPVDGPPHAAVQPFGKGLQHIAQMDSMLNMGSLAVGFGMICTLCGLSLSQQPVLKHESL